MKTYPEAKKSLVGSVYPFDHGQLVKSGTDLTPTHMHIPPTLEE